MNKVICDVCGTDYPETAARCPICGCARAQGGQTVAGNSTEEVKTYTYVKGGRFSKANVRKRLKASQQQNVIKQPEPVREPSKDDYDDEDEFDEEELDGVSNKGLILIVILLLLAIIAVSSYIAIAFFGGRTDRKPNYTQPTQSTQQSVPESTEPSNKDIPCTGLELNDNSIKLDNADVPWELRPQVQPADTTDVIEFISADTSVARIEKKGNVAYVYAVNSGETTITVRCGSFEAVLPVVIELDTSITEPSDPSIPDDPTEPSDGPTDPSQTEPITEPTTEPTVPSEPADVELKLNSKDFSLFSKGESHQLYNGELDRSKITWSSDNESVATVEDGKVVAVGPGRTTIHAVYEGQEVTCIVYCQFKEETEPTDPEPTDPEPTDPEPTDPEPTDPEPSDPEPSEPQSHTLLVNGSVPNYKFEEKDNSADVSLSTTVEENKSCTIAISGAEDVQWSNNDPSVCSYDPATGKVTALASGRAILTAQVDGVEYIVVIRVS